MNVRLFSIAVPYVLLLLSWCAVDRHGSGHAQELIVRSDTDNDKVSPPYERAAHRKYGNVGRGSSVEDSLASTMREGIESLSPEYLSHGDVPEQERLDTIVRAFRHLPPDEVVRLGVSLDEKILVGSSQADVLVAAWRMRQKELQDAMKNVLKPAEFMGNITLLLRNGVDSDGTLLTAARREELLVGLEGLLEDVDNARDFHTIGGWPVLIRMLLPNETYAVRTAAAWSIGTAVKNDYDYQLWTLEEIAAPHEAAAIWRDSLIDTFAGQQSNEGGEEFISCIALLLQVLEEEVLSSNTTEGHQMSDSVVAMYKKAMYAIAASMRGNVDVQNAVLQMRAQSSSTSIVHLQDVRFFKRLHELALNYDSLPVELTRKVWSFLADALEERAFIRQDLQSQAAIANAQIEAAMRSGDNDSQIAAQKLAHALDEVQFMLLPGDLLIAQDADSYFSTVALSTLQAFWMQLQQKMKKLNRQELNSVRATVTSILVYCKEVLKQRSVAVAFSAPVQQLSEDWRSELQHTVEVLILTQLHSNRIVPGDELQLDSKYASIEAMDGVRELAEELSLLLATANRV